MNGETWDELERTAVPEVQSPPIAGGLALWLSPSGRIPRSTYWLKFLLPIMGIQFLAAIMDEGSGHTSPDALGAWGSLAAIVVIWPALVGAIKRLHDLGHSGWLLLAVYGGAAVLGVIAAAAGPDAGILTTAAVVSAFCLIVFGLWVGLRMGFQRGNPHTNRFGPAPFA